MYYNSGNSGFYDPNINSIPSDSVEISDEYHAELLEKQSKGFIIRSDANGYPVAIERVLTADEIILKNKLRKQQLISIASENISVIQDAIDLGMEEDGDDGKLKLWKKYRILLNRIEVEQDTDINWPPPPF